MFESELLTQGFSTLLNNPQALLFATFGVMLGIVIGALPGLTATMGVAILLPFTYGMEPVSGLLMICGVFLVASTVVLSPQFCSKNSRNACRRSHRY